MPSALILGGTGQIGGAIANQLTALGWSVTVSSRNKPPARINTPHIIADAASSADLKDALRAPVDLLVSCAAYDKEHALALLSVRDKVGRIVVISSASVYQDKNGRTLDESRQTGFPEFDGPIDETVQTVAPGPQTYSTRKVEMERVLLDQGTVPVTVLRPCAVYGPYSQHAREWWFVKRLLDGRKIIPLAYGGLSRFQTSSVFAIADAVEQAFEDQLPNITNVCDADSPNVIEIGQAILNIMDREAELYCLSDTAYPPTAGATPWSLPKDFVVSSAVPGKLSYAASVGPSIAWLEAAVNTSNWKTLLPHLAGYPYEHFDYTLDDSVLKF